VIELGQQGGLLLLHERKIERAAVRLYGMAGDVEDVRVNGFGREREQDLLVGLDVPSDRHHHHHKKGDDDAGPWEEAPYIHESLVSLLVQS